MIYHISNITFLCIGVNDTIPGCECCVITLQCICEVYTEVAHFPCFVSACHNDTTIKKAHPVNLAVLQEFFFSSQLKDILVNTTFDDPISVDVPDFQVYKHKFADLIANDKKDDLILKKIIATVQKTGILCIPT